MNMKPWLLTHELDDGNIETILLGPLGAPMPAFALCAADIIRHIALKFTLPESEVIARVMKELNSPTSKITERHGASH